MWLVENGDGYHGRIKGTSEQTLRENILAIVDSIEDCKARTTVLSIINYLIQLYKTASDAGSPNAFGTAIGVGGLITGVVADIMGGMNSGEYYGTAEPPVRCGESHLSGLTEPLHFVY